MESQKKHPRTYSFEFFPPNTPEGQEKHAEVFNDPKWQESKRKKVDKLIASVTNGHGKKMPAFKDKLKPEEIRGLVEKDVLGPWK